MKVNNFIPRETKSCRLPPENYVGEVTVAITACVQNRSKLFTSPDLVEHFLSVLTGELCDNRCIALIYCFMPDHLHLIIQGHDKASEPLRAMKLFKQRTSYWLKKNERTEVWQPNFYDRVIRKTDELRNQIKYIAHNPVRAGMVEKWEDYRFTGSIGMQLQEL